MFRKVQNLSKKRAGNDGLTDQEIAEVQKNVEEIGKKRQDGLIVVVTKTDQDDHNRVEGYCKIHNMDFQERFQIAMSIIGVEPGKSDTDKMMMMMALMNQGD
jgi:hypothetical protein